MSQLSTIPLDDPEFFVSAPEAVLAALRRDQPVLHHERLGVWVLSRYQDVAFVLRNPELFASRFGVAPDEQGRPDLVLERRVKDSDFLLLTDPPLHEELRAIVQPGFRHRAFAEWEVRMEKLVSQLLDSFVEDTVVDLYAQLAKPLAIASICDFIGLPAEDVVWLGGALSSWAPEHLSHHDLDQPGRQTVESYFTEVLADKRHSGEADVLALIASGGDAQLPTQLMLAIDMIMAGDEPTAGSITGGFLALTQHPDQLERLLSDVSAVTTAADEILRWVSPVPLMCRTTMADVTVGDTVVPAESYVYLLLGSANRDERTWTNADQFDVTRADAAKHVAFGKGVHACIGAGVVRRLLRLILTCVVERFESIEAAGEVQFHPSNHMPTISCLPVRVRRRNGAS